MARKATGTTQIAGLYSANGQNWPNFYSGNLTGGYSVYYTSAINDNAWHHLVGIYNGTNALIYVDGVLRNQTNETGNRWINGSFTVGRDSVSTPTAIRYLNGSVDEVGIWMNYSLSASEVAELYNSGNGLNFSDFTNVDNFNISQNNFTYESKDETFIIKNLSSNAYSANLVWNGTSYPATKSGTQFTSSIDIPNVDTTTDIQFYWSVTFTHASGYLTEQTENYTQKVYPLEFVLCNATLTTKFINISFKKETDSSNMSATVPNSDWVYWIDNAVYNKTFNYVNNTANPSYAFCSNAVNETIYSTLSFQYANLPTYPQRIYNPSTLTLTNTTTNTTLYLLGSGGQYVTIQVVNSADQLLSGVNITVTREISGSTVTVGQGTTAADGSYTFWLNPDFTHTFTLEKISYTTYTTSFIPTQTSYTITLGSTATTVNDTYRGILYSIVPLTSYLNNNTQYTFAFNLTSSYWDTSLYGFNLRLANGTIITGNSTGTEGTNLIKIYNVNNQSIIYMDYYWVINGNYTNGTHYWTIFNMTNTNWSINTFFTDLNSYINTDMFGLDQFGRYLIIFMIIFFTCGIVSYKYGLTSPMAVSAMVFGIIFFLDIAISPSVLPTIKGIPHLLTFLSAAILVAMIFKEVQQ